MRARQPVQQPPAAGEVLVPQRLRCDPAYRQRSRCRRQSGQRVRDRFGVPHQPVDPEDPAGGDRGEERLEFHPEDDVMTDMRRGEAGDRPVPDEPVCRLVQRDLVEHLVKDPSLQRAHPWSRTFEQPDPAVPAVRPGVVVVPEPLVDGALERAHVSHELQLADRQREPTRQVADGL
jgi:hypothetical protein